MRNDWGVPNISPQSTGRLWVDASYRTLIDCIFVNADEIECQLREIAENLHRAELTALERDEHVAKWVELIEAKVAQFAPPCGGGQPAEKGIRKAVRELGIERTAAQRAVKVASLSDDAKQVARETGLDKTLQPTPSSACAAAYGLCADHR